MKALLAIAVTALVVIPAGYSYGDAGGVGPDCWGCASQGVKAQARAEIVRVFGGSSECALAIVNRESGYNPAASNWRDSGGGSHGLFQMHYPSHTWVNFHRLQMDIRYAVSVAWRLSRGGTRWGPWGGCP